MYTMQNGRAARTFDVEVLASGAHGATFNGAAVEVGDLAVLCLDLDVTAGSGTSPTLDVSIETSKDGSTVWRAIAAFAQKTGVASERKSFSGCDRFVRAAVTIGGTGSPSFTFSVRGEGK